MSAVLEQVMAQCSRGCFTGLLRIHTREGNGEIRFLSGIQDGVRFDAMEGDEAFERLLSATEPEFEAVSSLPPIDINSSEPVPPEGRLDKFHAAQLMRYCEAYSLTCALELEVNGKVLTARYRLGELLSVEPDSEHTAKMAEAKQGNYRLRLPRFELPASVAQRRTVPPAAAAPPPPPAAAAARAPAAPAGVVPTPPASPAAVRRPAPAAPKAVPVVAQPKIAPTAIVTPKAAPAGPRIAPAAVAPTAAAATSTVVVPARPAAAAPVPAAPAATGRAAPARQVEASVHTSPSPSVATSAAARPLPSPAPERAQAQPAPAAAAARGVQSPGASKPLEGLWKDAVLPPAQAAPLELEASPSSASRRPDSPGVGRASPPALSFGAAASQPSAASASGQSAATGSAPAGDLLNPPFRTPSRARYWWLLAVLVLAAVAAWVALGRPLP